MSDDPDNLEKTPRRFWPLAFKIIAIHLVIILAILIPVGIHENRQAERDWNEFKTHWEAKGEIFDLEKLIPPDIPDEENFAKAPIIAELFTDPDNNRLSNLDYRRMPGFAAGYVKSSDSGQRAIGGYGATLADHLEKPESFASEEKAAKAILKLFEPLAPIFDELEQASQRPKARFPLDYQNYSWNTMFYYVHIMQSVVPTLKLRARTRLVLGDPEGALGDILTVLRIANHTG